MAQRKKSRVADRVMHRVDIHGVDIHPPTNPPHCGADAGFCC